MRDEGVIKFNCEWKMTSPLPDEELRDLIFFRQKLFKLGLIGVYPDGIGFGNLSKLTSTQKKFIISGSQTGHLDQADNRHFSLITNYSVEYNRLTCTGPIKASSESLTHAMIYETFTDVKAVIHVHSAKLWNNLKNKVPTTGKAVPYGTPQMANEIKRLAAEDDLSRKRILVMAGHEDGVITFGKDLPDAYDTLMRRIS